MRARGTGPTSFEPEGEPVGTALLVPGRAYPPVAPLLFFAAQVLLQHRWRVQQHWWDPPTFESEEHADTWVRDQVTAALPTSGRALVVAKSLGTRAAPRAAEHEVPAVWLTPLLGHPPLVAGVAENPAPQLLVGGTADDIWDPAVARSLATTGCDVAELPGADHALLVPGDAARGVEVHAEVVRALDSWLERLSV